MSPLSKILACTECYGGPQKKTARTYSTFNIQHSTFRSPSEKNRRSQRGFTLASLLVILTVMSVILAFSVPRMWSDVMRREREQQTVWAMKQYARAIAEYQKKRGALPTKLEQLEEQTSPRVLRSLYPNPFSGEVDWIPTPPSTAAAQPGQPGAPGVPGLPAPTPGAFPSPSPSQPGLNPSTGLQGEYSGPIGGVRPPLTGASMIVLNGQDRYENWVYTITELAQEQSGGAPVQDPTRAAPLNPGRPNP
ncbi:MAG TPA: prepilin-type N-terminal cleavage/methylation domain-containing protein [Thermoanaerobaculia bacterium]|nr:prepilin-type N-terminal cleavage/methylation domain-containing protein [Thermoanaerobaculia bacterium]